MKNLLEKYELLGENAVEFVGAQLDWWSKDEKTALEINQREVNGVNYMTGYLMSTTDVEDVNLIFQVGLSTDLTKIEEDAHVSPLIVEKLNIEIPQEKTQAGDAFILSEISDFTSFLSALLNQYKDSEKLVFETQNLEDEEEGPEGTLLTLVGMVSSTFKDFTKKNIEEAISTGLKIEGNQYLEFLKEDVTDNEEDNYDMFFDFIQMTDFEVTREDLKLIKEVTFAQ